MRAQKAFYAIGGFAFCTIVIYYLLLINQPNSNAGGSGRQPEARRLQAETELLARAEHESRRNQRLSEYLHEFIKLKYKQRVLAHASSDLPATPYGLEHMPKAVIASGVPGEPAMPVTPVLVMACNRVTVQKCLNKLLLYRENEQRFPIIVSQDCGHEPTKRVIESYGSQLTLIEQPDLSDINVPFREKKYKGYYKIARHYGWALNTTFKHGYEAIIIVEDDLEVAPDFYEYFQGTYELLKTDPTLWCISAWNDNGRPNCIDTSASSLLYRTDFFPGLGWMLTKELWSELAVKWPKSFWDDWMRHPAQRLNRSCIRPEISRTKTFGKNGTSNGLFYEKYLKHMYLDDSFVKFTDVDSSHLRKENYDEPFLKEVFSYPLVTFQELHTGAIKVEGPVRLQYATRSQYKLITKSLDLMDDFKSGVPRTAYYGIVSFYHKKRRVYLHPSTLALSRLAAWRGYDLTWS